MAEICKFDELRVKTEGQLVRLINNELERGIREAHRALRSADNWALAEESYVRAKAAHAKASRLIPLIVEIAEDERSRVESRLELLHGMLEALSFIGSTPMPAEDVTAALARAFWKARGCPEGVPEDDWFRAERALKTQRESNAVCFTR